MLGFRKVGIPQLGVITNIQIQLGDYGLSAVLDNPNAYGLSLDDNFGFSVATSESYTIVGAPFERDAGGTFSGKAYIYNTSTGALLYTLNNPNAYNTSQDDNFGYSVGISNSYAIVGAYLEDDAGGTGSGKAYIYSTSTGSLLYTLDNPNAYNTSQDDRFAWSVAISDSYAIVGAYNEDDAGGLTSGKAYIYSTSTGSLLYTLNNPNAYDTSTGDGFGYAVGISNSYAIVSAYQEDDASGLTSGKAYIYSTSTGSLLYTLNNPNPYSTSTGDTFGYAVGISNSYAIVGAYQEDDASGASAGKAYIYSTSTGSLLYTLNNPTAYGTAAGDTFGKSVAISNSYAIVGAPAEDDATITASGAGKAYIYSTSTGSLLYTLDNPNAYGTTAGDQFGLSVGISDSCAIVGAYEDDAGGSLGYGSGKAYLYSRIESNHISNPSPTGLVYVNNATSGSSTVVIPSNAIVGDIAILCDTSTTTTDTTPSGWTSMNKATTTGIRTNVSYKKLVSGDPGSTITGMTGTTRKVILIFRNVSNSNPTITVTSTGSEATTLTPANQTITAGSGKTIYLAVYGKTTSTTPTTTLTATDVTATNVQSVTTSGVYTKHIVYDTGTNAVTQTNATVSMTDAGTNTMQSFRISIS